MNTATRRCFVLSLLLLLALRPLQAAETGVITGTVTDPDGKPVPGAAVTLSRVGAISERAMTVVSDARGRFRADGLALGIWRFSVKASGYYEKTLQDGTFAGPKPTRHPSIVLSSGSSAGTVTLVMHPPSVLYGRVLTADGKPVMNQPVWFVYGGSNHFFVVHKKVVCDASGYYRQSVDYEGDDQFGVFDEVSGNYLPLTKFTYVGGRRTRRDIHLIRGASVSGRVVAADGTTPVAGASIWAEYDYFEGGSPAFRAAVKNDMLIVDWSQDARTGADGSFRLPVNPGMTYTLQAGTLTHRNVPEKAPKVRLPDGEHRAGFKLVLDERLGLNEPDEHHRTRRLRGSRPAPRAR